MSWSFSLKMILCCVALVFAATVQAAATAPAPAKKKTDLQTPPPIHFLLSYGSEMRPEKDVNDDWANHSLTNYALGAGWGQWLFLIERAQFQESSGNVTLNVQRQLEDNMFWAQWRAIQWNKLTPYVGAGLGAYRETIVTKLMGVSTTDESPWRTLTGMNFGLAFEPSFLWVAAEARVLFGDQLDAQPTLGAVLRAGLWF